MCSVDSRWAFQRRDRLYTSESDVYRRQILMSKVGPRTKKIKSGPTEGLIPALINCLFLFW